jgi:hypothetical protein
MILAGAAFSTADQIRRRWQDLVEWSNRNGFSDELKSLLPCSSPKIDVAKSLAGVSDDGTGWWPVWGEQNHEPKERPSRELVREVFDNLMKNWMKIVGAELGGSTKPLRFTGRKSRRLLVAADLRVTPPWGSWYSASIDPNAFRQFRKKINEAIVPMEVDDIGFNTSEGWQQ